MRTRIVPQLLVCAAVLVAACAESDVPTDAEMTGPSPQFSRHEGGGPLDVYNGGVDRATPRRPCLHRPANRQFDFWVGQWDVTNAAGAPAGTNVVRSELDGCLIHENWTSASGGRGRSLNTYDSDTGMWHQTWVSSFDTGHLRMAGGLEGLVMRMDGVRTQPNGVQWLDAYTWTPQGDDELIQAGRLQIPAGGIDFSFALTYTRTPAVMPAPEAPTTACQPGGRSESARQLDFWHGRWRVLRHGGKPFGSAEITSDLSGCLTEERFHTSKGFGSIAFAYFDLIEQRWYRTYIDSEGERVELRGEVGAGPLVMTGFESGPGQHGGLVRVTISPVSEDMVHQRWEISDDDGVRWHKALMLIYVRE
jgi:hypothetical protein